MPLVRVDLRKGKDAAHPARIGRVVRGAVVAPVCEKFQVVTEHDWGNCLFDRECFDIHRTDDPLMIQITWNEGHTVEKKEFYETIADGLAETRHTYTGDLRAQILLGCIQ